MIFFSPFMIICFLLSPQNGTRNRVCLLYHLMSVSIRCNTFTSPRKQFQTPIWKKLFLALRQIVFLPKTNKSPNLNNKNYRIRIKLLAGTLDFSRCCYFRKWRNENAYKYTGERRPGVERNEEMLRINMFCESTSSHSHTPRISCCEGPRKNRRRMNFHCQGELNL